MRTLRAIILITSAIIIWRSMYTSHLYIISAFIIERIMYTSHSYTRRLNIITL